jgi:hypothetical protein
VVTVSSQVVSGNSSILEKSVDRSCDTKLVTEDQCRTTSGDQFSNTESCEYLCKLRES